LLRELPDRFTINGKTYTNASAESVDPETAWNGQWNWDNTNKEIKFIGTLLLLNDKKHAHFV
jgi:hypothetical protein